MPGEPGNTCWAPFSNVCFRLEGPGLLPFQDYHSTPADEGGHQALPDTDTSAIEPTRALLCPDSTSPASSTLHSSTTSSAPHSSTSSRNLRSSYMSLPDTGRPGSAQHTLTRVHCPTAASSCWQHPFPSTSRNSTSLPSVQHNNYY